MQRAIRFTPHYQERIWGGSGLKSHLNREVPNQGGPYGESWDISARPEAVSTVENGPLSGNTLPELWNAHRDVLFGERFSNYGDFPLLFKVLDAREKLSIQVHPPKGVAAELRGESKNEMWYITHAEPGAKLYIGLRDGVTREQFAESIKTGEIEELVHAIEPEKDQFIYIPSGRLHAIGAGLLIYEIQQSSDTTYRVFDWNRNGIDGKPRELHIEESLRCIDFGDVEPEMDDENDGILTECEDFIVRRAAVEADETIAVTVPEECAFYTVVAGEIHAGEDRFGVGDFFMLPKKGCQLVAGQDGATYLETTIA